MFEKIEDAYVILFRRGVYRQATAYKLGRNLFAKHGAGYIALRANGNTSTDSRWMEIKGVSHKEGRFGSVEVLTAGGK